MSFVLVSKQVEIVIVKKALSFTKLQKALRNAMFDVLLYVSFVFSYKKIHEIQKPNLTEGNFSVLINCQNKRKRCLHILAFFHFYILQYLFYFFIIIVRIFFKVSKAHFAWDCFTLDLKIDLILVLIKKRRKNNLKIVKIRSFSLVLFIAVTTINK